MTRSQKSNSRPTLLNGDQDQSWRGGGRIRKQTLILLIRPVSSRSRFTTDANNLWKIRWRRIANEIVQ